MVIGFCETNFDYRNDTQLNTLMMISCTTKSIITLTPFAAWDGCRIEWTCNTMIWTHHIFVITNSTWLTCGSIQPGWGCMTNITNTIIG
jgi:hypothetical protein